MMVRLSTLTYSLPLFFPIFVLSTSARYRLQKPQRTKNGKSVLSRSILGKPETFDAIERSKSGRQSSSRSQSRSSTPQMDAGRTSAQGGMGDTSKMTLSSEMDLDSPRSEDSVDEESKAMTNEEYLMTLKRLQQHQLRVRSHDIEREANFTKYLPMSERLTLTKESKVLSPIWWEGFHLFGPVIAIFLCVVFYAKWSITEFLEPYNNVFTLTVCMAVYFITPFFIQVVFLPVISVTINSVAILLNPMEYLEANEVALDR